VNWREHSRSWADSSELPSTNKKNPDAAILFAKKEIGGTWVIRYFQPLANVSST